jgi:hypothetical protein
LSVVSAGEKNEWDDGAEPQEAAGPSVQAKRVRPRCFAREAAFADWRKEFHSPSPTQPDIERRRTGGGENDKTQEPRGVPAACGIMPEPDGPCWSAKQSSLTRSDYALIRRGWASAWQ